MLAECKMTGTESYYRGYQEFCWCCYRVLNWLLGFVKRKNNSVLNTL